MKSSYLIVSLIINLCFSMQVIAEDNNTLTTSSQVFKTIEQAQKYCPSVNSIHFTTGLPAPGKLAEFAYLTATFSAAKNGMTFMNSAANASCPVGTHNPQAVSTKEEHEQAKKAGTTICYLIPKPIVAKDIDILQNVEFTRIKGNYGSTGKGIIRCNYKYQGAQLDPETKKSLDGLVILRNK